MKSFYKTITALICIMTFGVDLPAQGNTSDTSVMERGKIEPKLLPVTYDKTTHLIFPSAIRYVDLGSGYLIADKAEGAENVLRLKSAIPSFEAETNFSVITEDGKFYNFNAVYSAHPHSLNYDIAKMQYGSGKANDILFEDLGKSQPSLLNLLMETIYHRNKRLIRHIAARGYGIQFLLKGIYVHEGKYFFLVETWNKSNVPFEIDFINFKIADKKIAKRTVIQEQNIIPLRRYKMLTEIAGMSRERNVFLLDRFTIANDKILLIEVFEKNGGRHQVLQIENVDLIHAKLVKNMHLQMKTN